MKLLTTTEAAYLVGVSPKSFAKWARRHGLTPQRRGRVHYWDLSGVTT